MAKRPCKACGTWTCDECGWQRTKANLTSPFHYCKKCGSTRGTRKGKRHRDDALTKLHETEFAKEIATMEALALAKGVNSNG